jgi:hypothetical protein
MPQPSKPDMCLKMGAIIYDVRAGVEHHSADAERRALNPEDLGTSKDLRNPGRERAKRGIFA